MISAIPYRLLALAGMHLTVAGLMLITGLHLVEPDLKPLAFLTASYLDTASPGSGTDPAIGQPRANSKHRAQPALLFEMETEPVVAGDILEKWHRMKADIAAELDALHSCHMAGPCSPAAQRLIDLSAEGAGRSGRARVGLINRAVDLAIASISDERQWGVADHWSAPFETLQSSRGDCEDYAIVKYLALLEAGLPADDVKIVILKNLLPSEQHAAVAARVDGEWLILDNLRLALVRDTDVVRAVPEFVLDQQGARRFVATSRDRRNGATAG
jgi:predicted transglutaminase-like cysteine proteinase